MNITANRANSYSGTVKRSAADIKYIVLHYTGNKTDSAMANTNCFARQHDRKAGAHYFVDENQVVQSVPDNVVAWSVGGARQSKSGGTFYGKCTNHNSISIEMCSTAGVIPYKTIKLASALTAELMTKYHVPKEHVIRHYDVTGKACPGWAGWLGSNAHEWKMFKDALGSTKGETPRGWNGKVTCNTLNVRKGPGTKYEIVRQIHANDVVTVTAQVNGFAQIGYSEWVCTKYLRGV